MTDQGVLEAIVRSLDTQKAEDILVLDIGKESGFADYFIIASGRNPVHVQALANYVEGDVKKTGTDLVARVEGAREGEWILMDYGPLIVHIFIDQERSYYNLEKLWGDAREVDISPYLL